MNTRPQETYTSLAAYIRKGCTQKDVRVMLLAALRSPDLVSARRISKGILLEGPRGWASAHMTMSGSRSVQNTLQALRRAGITLPR